MIPPRVPKYKDWSKLGVSFGVSSHTERLTFLTSLLGIAPSSAFEKGDEHMSHTGVMTRPWSVWTLKSTGHIESESMVDHVAWLLDILEAKTDKIKELKDNPAYETSVGIDIPSPNAIGGTSIPSDMVRRLAVLSNRMNFRLWGYIPDEFESVDSPS